MYIVKVGAVEGVKPKYAENSGFNYYVFTGVIEAHRFISDIKTYWETIPVSKFVYGLPVVELIFPLLTHGNPAVSAAERAGRNWHKE